LPILASFCKISKNLLVLEVISQLLEEVFQLLFTLFLLLQEIAHICLQLLHLGVEVYLLITIAKLDVFAGYKDNDLLAEIIKFC